MADDPKRKLDDSFEDRPATIFVGLLCLVYYYYHFVEGAVGPVTRILPPFPGIYFAGLSLLTAIIQIVVWRKFGHFTGKWYRNPRAYLLFLCEFFIISFALCFMTWPIYYVMLKFGTLPPLPINHVRP